MNAATLPFTDVNSMAQAYVEALRSYLQGAGEAALQRAYEIGRNALSTGTGLIALSQLHHRALDAFLQTPSAAEREHAMHAAAIFFAECIAPYEMTYGGFREANQVLRHFNELLEQEAQRIAYALHDEAGQLLMAVYLSLDQLAQQWPDTSAHVANTVGLLDQIETQLRRLSHELTPALLNDLGLVPALRYLTEGLMQRAKLHIDFDCLMQERLPHGIETALYRITQEALNNVLRHARASHVQLRMVRETGAVVLSVRDDGAGFDPDATYTHAHERGFGLPGMRERLNSVRGNLHLHSAPGQGTELTVRIPLES